MPLAPTTPELAALDLFVSVVELGSLSKAAAAHGIAQPSASSRVRYLERQVGLTLLDRTPSGSSPTAAGRLVAGWAEQVLRAASELNAGVDALKASRSGRLRIAASLTIAEYLLPPWLETFLRHRPTDSINLDVANSAAVLDRLSKRRADLGFIESPETAATMSEQLVAHDRLVVIVGQSHPWGRRSEVELDELASTPLILREAGSGTREALEAALGELGFDAPRSALELGSTAAVRAAVIAGTSPTVISERAVVTELAAGSLIEISVPGLSVHRRLRAVWPSDRPLPPLAVDLLASLPRTDVGGAESI